MSRLLIALLLVCTLPVYADDVRELQWADLIPEGDRKSVV